MTDPRPYNYQFRRPRLYNPTYQSYNAYESLYHRGKNQYQNMNIYNNNNYTDRQYPYNHHEPYNYNNYDNQSGGGSEMSNRSKKPRYQSIGINTENRSNKASSNYSQRSSSSLSSNQQGDKIIMQNKRASILSTYGTNSLQRKEKANYQIANNNQSKNVSYNKDMTSQVFKKQQKPFNIINLYQKNSEPLKKYQKLTLQHLMYEKGIQNRAE